MRCGVCSHTANAWPSTARARSESPRRAVAMAQNSMISASSSFQAFMRSLLNWRKQADVIHDGKLMQFTPIGNVYAYFRYDDENTVMVVFNLDDDEVELDLARFAERLQGATRAHDVLGDASIELGSELELAPRSALLLEITH